MTPSNPSPDTGAGTPLTTTWPCINCGTPMDECDYDRRCCEDSDHPFPTIRTTLAALHDDVDAARSRPATDAAGLDVERLARALVNATRAAGTENRTDLHGHGWPAYSEWRNGHETTVTLIVNDLAERLAAEYARLSVADGPGPEERP